MESVLLLLEQPRRKVRVIFLILFSSFSCLPKNFKKLKNAQKYKIFPEENGIIFKDFKIISW